MGQKPGLKSGGSTLNLRMCTTVTMAGSKSILGITGWGSRPYPQFYLDTMLVTGAVWDKSHFADAEFDELTATAGTTLDENERVRPTKPFRKYSPQGRNDPVLLPAIRRDQR